MKNNIDLLLKEKFGLRLEHRTDSDVLYSNGNRALYVNDILFEYYNKSTNEVLPITTDIQIMVDLIRSDILGINPKYTILSDYDIRKVVKINEKH